jgi:hypothetical protein
LPDDNLLFHSKAEAEALMISLAEVNRNGKKNLNATYAFAVVSLLAAAVLGTASVSAAEAVKEGKPLLSETVPSVHGD